MPISRCFGDTLLKPQMTLLKHTGSEALWIITSSKIVHRKGGSEIDHIPVKTKYPKIGVFHEYLSSYV
jgi:hypothetical protein